MGQLSICMLGGTGFVGRHLAARLAADGHSLNILTRSRERNRDLLVLPTATLTRCNVGDPEALEREFAGCDAVINLIGILNERGHDGRGFREIHVELPRKVAAACRRQGVPRLLHMSALKADAANGPSHYLRSKGEGEAAIQIEGGTVLRITILQPSVIFGPEDSFINRFSTLLRRAPYVFPLAKPNARFAPVYVGDVAEAFARCLTDRQSYGQTYQLCGPRIYSLRELLNYILSVLALKRKIVGLSDSMSRLQAHVLGHIPGKPFSMDNYNSLRINSICDENGLKALGVTPTPLETIVPRYLRPSSQRALMDQFRARSPGRGQGS